MFLPLLTQGGQFRIKLVLSKDFPASPPKGFFLTKIFHPNVSCYMMYRLVIKLLNRWEATVRSV